MSAPAAERKSVHILLPASLSERLRLAARAERRTQTAIIQIALERYMGLRYTLDEEDEEDYDG